MKHKKTNKKANKQVNRPISKSGNNIYFIECDLGEDDSTYTYVNSSGKLINIYFK